MNKTIVNKIRTWKNRFVEVHFPKVFCKTPFLASVYYLLFSSAFSREHQAVLSGKAMYLRDVRKTKSNYFLLVRNTHRIEKGLLMRPRKEVFAEKYIAETVDAFGYLHGKEFKVIAKQGTQQKWFKDVITEYFNQVADSASIQKERDRFRIILNGHGGMSEGPRSIPYIREPGPDISFDAFYQLNLQRRSVRWYLPRVVPREVIDKAILAARQAPSACNRQPFEFRVFDDPEMVKKLVALPMGTKGYEHSIPVFVVLIGSLAAYSSERDRHLIYIDASLAAMIFMLALERLGLSSCAINWPDIPGREEKMKTALNLKPWERPVMCLGLGYPDPVGKVAFSEKRNLDQIRTFNSKS